MLWVFFSLAAVAAAVYRGSECPEVDVIVLNGTYHFVVDTCQVKTANSIFHSCSTCNLLIPRLACIARPRRLSDSACDVSEKCKQFRCSDHEAGPLAALVDACREGWAQPRCEPSRGSGSCGLSLVTPNSLCAPPHVIEEVQAAPRDVRFPISEVMLDVFSGLNSSLVDIQEDEYYEEESDEDPDGLSRIYFRTHAPTSVELEYDNDTDPHADLLKEFIPCAGHLLEISDLVLLYLPDSRVFEIGQRRMPDDTSKSKMFVCTQIEEDFSIAINYLLMYIGVALSLLGLVLTVMSTFLLGEQRSVPGLNLLCTTASLVVAYATLPIGLLGTMTVCGWAGMFHVYAILANVFWMNIMAFDIWRTLSTFRRIDRYAARDHRGKVTAYWCYGWGMPAMLVSTGVSFDQTEGVPGHMRPRFLYNCWFLDETTTGTIFLYFVPMWIVIIANTIFFLMTSVIFCKAQQQRQSPKGGVHDSSERYNLSLYVKLFLVMGLTWILETLSMVIESERFVLVASLINTLQGVFIFFIFCFKKRVWVRLKECCGCSSPDGSPQNSRYSQYLSADRRSTKLGNYSVNGTTSL